MEITPAENANVSPIVSHLTGLDLVVSNILAQHPVRMPLAAAAKLIGYPTTAAAHTARSRGLFPLRIRQESCRLVVFTSDLLDYLRNGESQAAQSVKPLKKAWKIRTGRPSKMESLEAARLNLSVRELRAQRQLELGGAK